MADDVEVEAERAANAARTAVKRSRQSSTSLLPIVLVGFAVLTAVAVLMMDKGSLNPQTPRVDLPTNTQPITQPNPQPNQ